MCCCVSLLIVSNMCLNRPWFVPCSRGTLTRSHYHESLPMSPYEIFVEAAKENPDKSFRDLWRDFRIWESSRGYVDDPSASSKNAIAWVRELDEVVAQLDEFEGVAKENCLNALEAAFVAFARLDHTDELCNAVRCWREWRLTEKVARDDAFDVGHKSTD